MRERRSLLRLPGALRLLGVAVLACLLPALGCRPRPPSPDVVAQSRFGLTTRAELDAYILAQPADERRPEAGEEPLSWRRRRLVGLLVGKALEEEARSLGLATTAEGAARLRGAREELLLELMRGRTLGRQVRISDQDIRAYYEAHPDEFLSGEQIRLSHVFRRVARHASAAERAAVSAEMEELRRQLLDGVDFGDLASTRSDSETAERRGLIGQVGRGDLDSSFEAIVWGLEEGGLSQVVPTYVGFHIFKVDNRLPPTRTDLDEVRGRIRKRLAAKARSAAIAELRAALLAAAEASYHPRNLDPAWSRPEAVLLAMPGPEGAEQGLTVARFRQLWEQASFRDQRVPGLAEQLDRVALDRLLLWKAASRGLTESPRLAARERHELVEMAFKRRVEQWLGELDDEVLRQVYEQAQDRFRTPQLHHLWLLTRELGDRVQPYTVYEELAALAAEIRAGRRGFAAAARELSDDPSAGDGGDAGWVRLDHFLQWAGEAAQAVLATLPTGVISEPILLLRKDQAGSRLEHAGYLLVKVEGIREPELPPFAQVRSQVGNLYLDQHGEQATEEISARVLEELAPVIFEDSL